MLTASNDAPKPDGESAPASTAPTPTNWKGVRHGLAHAERCLKAGELDEAEAAHCRDKAERLRASTGGSKRPTASVQLAKLLWQQGEFDTARAMLAILMLRRPEDERLQKLRDAWVQED